MLHTPWHGFKFTKSKFSNVVANQATRELIQQEENQESIMLRNQEVHKRDKLMTQSPENHTKKNGEEEDKVNNVEFNTKIRKNQ